MEDRLGIYWDDDGDRDENEKSSSDSSNGIEWLLRSRGFGFFDPANIDDLITVVNDEEGGESEDSAATLTEGLRVVHVHPDAAQMRESGLAEWEYFASPVDFSDICAHPKLTDGLRPHTLFLLHLTTEQSKNRMREVIEKMFESFEWSKPAFAEVLSDAESSPPAVTDDFQEVLKLFKPPGDQQPDQPPPS